MTTRSTAAEQQRIEGLRAPKRLPTMANTLAAALFALVEEVTGLRWPSERYRAEPVRFYREILGVEPWSKQIEIIESVRDNPRTAAVSGHRSGKSTIGAGSGLWFYCSYEDARVTLTSKTARQVDDILWRELRMMVTRSGICIACRIDEKLGKRTSRPCPHSAIIDGELGSKARTGLVPRAGTDGLRDDFREVKGYTADEVEAITGIAGKNLLTVVDEASGVEEEIFEGLEGNRAGWTEGGDGIVRQLLLGNGTKTSGEFFEAFHKKKGFYHCVRVSSEETPNVVEKREVYPGLASFDWVEEKKKMWGEQSALYIVRVKGWFATKEDGKIFSVHAIGQAEERWREQEKELEAGEDDGLGLPRFGGRRLWIGVDPAGESGTGDEAVFFPRRGARALDPLALRGLTPEAHAAHLLGMIAQLKEPRERPVVVLDREGAVGADVYGVLKSIADEGRGPFELVSVRASDGAHREPITYDRMRDELVANLKAWFDDEGAIPEDTQLEAELHEFEWIQVERRLKATPKKAIRKKLGRSPDRFDALALACWVPRELQLDAPPEKGKRGRDEDDDEPAPMGDVYAHRRASNPYGHRR